MKRPRQKLPEPKPAPAPSAAKDSAPAPSTAKDSKPVPARLLVEKDFQLLMGELKRLKSRTQRDGTPLAPEEATWEAIATLAAFVLSTLAEARREKHERLTGFVKLSDLAIDTAKALEVERRERDEQFVKLSDLALSTDRRTRGQQPGSAPVATLLVRTEAPAAPAPAPPPALDGEEGPIRFTLQAGKLVKLPGGGHAMLEPRSPS